MASSKIEEPGKFWYNVMLHFLNIGSNWAKKWSHWSQTLFPEWLFYLCSTWKSLLGEAEICCCLCYKAVYNSCDNVTKHQCILRDKLCGSEIISRMCIFYQFVKSACAFILSNQGRWLRVILYMPRERCGISVLQSDIVLYASVFPFCPLTTFGPHL
jgi:hypothetical protein